MSAQLLAPGQTWVPQTRRAKPRTITEIEDGLVWWTGADGEANRMQERSFRLWIRQRRAVLQSAEAAG